MLRRQVSGTTSGASSAVAPLQQTTNLTGNTAQGGTPKSPPGVGTGFVGFDRYFQANRQGAQQMADRVAGGVQQQAQQAQQAIKGAQDTFAKKAQQDALTYDPNANWADVEARADSGDYAGPKTWKDAGVDVAGVSDKVVAAQGQVANLGTTGGRAALLRESYRSGPSTSGGSALDAALMGQAGGQRFAELQGYYGGIGQELKDAQAGTTAIYDAASAEHAQARDQYRGDLAKARDVKHNVLPTEQAPVAPGNPPKKRRNWMDRVGSTIFGG